MDFLNHSMAQGKLDLEYNLFVTLDLGAFSYSITVMKQCEPGNNAGLKSGNAGRLD